MIVPHYIRYEHQLSLNDVPLCQKRGAEWHAEDAFLGVCEQYLGCIYLHQWNQMVSRLTYNSSKKRNPWHKSISTKLRIRENGTQPPHRISIPWSRLDIILPIHGPLRLFNHICTSLDYPDHHTRDLPSHDRADPSLGPYRHQLRVFHRLINELFLVSTLTDGEVNQDGRAERAYAVQDIDDASARVRSHVPDSINAGNRTSQSLGVCDHVAALVEPGVGKERGVGPTPSGIDVDVYRLDGVVW